MTEKLAKLEKYVTIVISKHEEKARGTETPLATD